MLSCSLPLAAVQSYSLSSKMDVLRVKKTRFAPSPLLLEAEAGGFYRPLRYADVRGTLVKSPGFWLMLAVVAYQFVMSVIPSTV